MNVTKNRWVKKKLEELRHRYYGYRSRKLFDGVEYFCLFIGHPRSGHTLVGAFVDAHPDAVLSMGGHLPIWLERGFTRNHMYALIIERAKAFASRGAKWNYHYDLNKQWQGGRYRKLRIIGDHRAGETTRMFGANPELLDRLRQTVRVPLKVIHVVRNPYDNITTIARKHHKSLLDSIDYYFSMCTEANSLMTRLNSEECITIRHENIITEPGTELRRLLEFFCLDTDDDYLEDCARIVYNSPNRSRNDGDWTTELKNAVDERIDEHPLLSNYTFDN